MSSRGIDSEKVGAGPDQRKVSRQSTGHSTESPETVSELRTIPAKKPRLLFLSYFFPPLRTVACVRSYGIAKWLARSGWDVTVVTPNASVWRRTENAGDVDRVLESEGVHLLRTRHPWSSLGSGHLRYFYDGTGPIGERIGFRLVTWGQRIAARWNLPGEIGWIREAERVCATLAPGSADLILVTGSPFAAFGVGQRLSRRLGCPYVLDYRDLWSGNPYVKSSPSHKQIEEERSLLAKSAAVIAVSPGVSKALQKLFGIGSKVSVIMNGYDSEELSAVVPHSFDHFAVVYAGQFYPPKRVVTPLMTALAHLARHRPALGPWALHYYGRDREHVHNAARQCGVEDRIVLHGDVFRAEALAAVRGAGMTVVISSVASQATLEDQGVVTGKIFEAIGLGIPILAIAPPGSDLETVLAKAGLGRRFSGNETEAMASYLAEAIEGRTPPPNEPEVFDWVQIGRSLDRLLREVVKTAAGAASHATAPESFSSPHSNGRPT